MTDRGKSRDLDWPSIRSLWRQQEEDIRAPNTILSDVFQQLERKKQSRQGYIRFGFMAAASSALVFIFMALQHSPQDAMQPVQVTEVSATPVSPVTSGPCGLAGSCVDLHQKLARVEIGRPGNARPFGVLNPRY